MPLFWLNNNGIYMIITLQILLKIKPHISFPVQVYFFWSLVIAFIYCLLSFLYLSQIYIHIVKRIQYAFPYIKTH